MLALRGGRVRWAVMIALVGPILACGRSIAPHRDGAAGSGGRPDAVFYPSGSGPGGQGGQGNASGTSSSAGSGSVEPVVPPTGAPAWMYDPAGWESVDTLPGCITRVARDPQAIHPGLAFASCGPGCRRADVIPGTRSAAAILGTSARMVGGEFFASLSARIEADRTAYLMGTYRLGDGKPTVLIAEDGHCIAQLAGRGSLSTFRVFPRTGDFQSRIGWVEPSTGKLSWLSPPSNWVFEGFDYGSGWGGRDVYGYGDVFIAPEPTRAEVTLLFSSTAPKYYAFAAEDVVTLTERGERGRVLLWTPGSAMWPVAEGQWEVASVGVSTERVAWLAGTGERAQEGQYEATTLYSCALPEPGEACNVEEGPTLPFFTALSVLSVQGRWIALIGCSESDCDAYLVDWEEGTTYRIERVSSDHVIQVIGLSDTELIVADSSPEVGSPDFDGLIRYDLGHLEDFATRL